MLDKIVVRVKEMKYLEGRLNHTAWIIILGRNFLNRIRNTNDKAIKIEQPMTLNSGTRDNYNIWLQLIKRSNEGVSMNNIFERLPINIYISYYWSVILGVMPIHGQAWRYNIPIPLQGSISNNTLYYIAEIITIWVNIIEGRMEN